MEYVVILEKEPRSDWGAYVPDLPGCVAKAPSRVEVEQLIEEAIQIHLAGMREDGLPIPEPTSSAFLLRESCIEGWEGT